jgi:hypothetical protein
MGNSSSRMINGGVGMTGFKSVTSTNTQSNKTALKWCFKPGKSPIDSPQEHISLIGCEFIPMIDNNDPNALDLTLQAIGAIGQPNECGIAVTEAFEILLSKEYIPCWTEKDTESLSIYFITAFSRPLTPALDLTHTIRSRALEKFEIAWLCGLSQNIIDPLNNILHLYQDPP